MCENSHVKCRRPRAGTTICASQRSRNACGHFTKSNFLHAFTGKMPPTGTGDHTFCELAHSKCIWTFHKRHFIQKFTGKIPPTRNRDHTLCEPAQPTCTWTCHKSHFLREFAGIMLRDFWCGFSIAQACTKCGSRSWDRSSSSASSSSPP